MSPAPLSSGVWQQLLTTEQAINFVRTGGTLILSAGFSWDIGFPEVDKFFIDLGLSWRFVEYRRKEYVLNRAMKQVDTSCLGRLWRKISIKGNHLEDVSGHDAIYLPDLSSPKEIMHPRETPAALGTCGQGKVGYVSDVNPAEPTALIVLAMCGLGG